MRGEERALQSSEEKKAPKKPSAAAAISSGMSKGDEREQNCHRGPANQPQRTQNKDAKRLVPNYPIRDPVCFSGLGKKQQTNSPSERPNQNTMWYVGNSRCQTPNLPAMPKSIVPKFNHCQTIIVQGERLTKARKTKHNWIPWTQQNQIVSVVKILIHAILLIRSLRYHRGSGWRARRSLKVVNVTGQSLRVKPEGFTKETSDSAIKLAALFERA